MATYPGMTLGGEIRESVSLDEDDLSDVEDEVFIRDGKNSYKVAEELNMKRPLMAPRRKLGKSNLSTRLKGKPPCRAFCKPCCYIFAALIMLIGVIVLVVILVSIFPLPLDRLRNWLVTKAKKEPPMTLLPCKRLNVEDVWITNLPILTTDSPIRTVDIDGDGIEDILFGFGTGDNYDVLPPDLFCPIFLGVSPPCQGGVIALNGSTGEVVWRYWTNDTIFNLQCIADLNNDGTNDCLAVGTEGTILAINSKNGSPIWRQNNNRVDIFVANLIPDQNNDNVSDILSSHSSLINGSEGHLVLISGKNGEEIKRVRIPYHAATFFMPQLLKSNNTDFVIFGTGTPKSPGNLSVATLEEIKSGNLTSRTLYEDHYKGVLTQPVLVDVTGDGVNDIVAAMFNSTIVAINGATFEQIWNYTVVNAETNITPTPGYFNDDNVTDFLIIYEEHDAILDYNYTRTFILDGRTGREVYKSVAGRVVATQMNGLTLSMESKGFDMFVYWTVNCIPAVVLVDELPPKEKSDFCSHLPQTLPIVSLNALNQFDQPPGFEIYSSAFRYQTEFQHISSAYKKIKDYFNEHPNSPLIKIKTGQLEMNENYGGSSQNIKVNKYGSSSFRHKDNRGGIYLNENDNLPLSEAMIPNEELVPIPNDPEPEDEYPIYTSERLENPYIERDPRSKKDEESKSKKRNLSSPRYGIYDYQNIKMSRNRLLNDLNNLPYDILRDTYYKNRESQLRKSRFEQRDITSHIDKIKQNEELKNIIEKEKKSAENASYSLWDLESEKELQDKENGYWRGKRQVGVKGTGLRKITSVGAILSPINTTINAMDIVFLTYWIPPKIRQVVAVKEALTECVEDKLKINHNNTYSKENEKELKDRYISECKAEEATLKEQFEYFDRIKLLNLGEMTVYRLRIDCWCYPEKANERCAKFLPQEQQMWPMYLGKYGDGVFPGRK